jgi:hypothetical protein
MSTTSSYVLVKGDLGLGNRILCLLSAILLARITGRRLLLDWTDELYSGDGRNAFEHLFRLDLAAPIEELPDTESVRPAIWRGHLRDSATALRVKTFGREYIDPWIWEPFCTDVDRIDHDERVLVFTTFFERIDPLRRHLTGELETLRSLPSGAILQRLWAQHLELAPPLRERVDDFRRQHLGSPTLGVHVRDSDRRTRVDAIRAATDRCAGLHPGKRIFLATDNAAVLGRYRERFRDIVSTEKWYPPPGEAMHTHASRPDPIAGAADALVDIHLLAECDPLIVDSRSSFGRLAALRASAHGREVIDVYPGRMLPVALRQRLLRLKCRARRWRAGIDV